MRKFPAMALAGAGAAALAGTAFAATPSADAAKMPAARMHVMNVPLADGSSVRVEYAGEVAPKVTVVPDAMADAAGTWAMPFPSFAGFDRMMRDMQRQSQEMIRHAQEMAHQPAGPGGAAPYIASYGNFPSGGTSTTVVSYSNGGSTCTRTTEVVSQGAGKPPKVTSNVSGQCAAPAQPSGPAVNRT